MSITPKYWNGFNEDDHDDNGLTHGEARQPVRKEGARLQANLAAARIWRVAKMRGPNSGVKR